MIKNKAIAHYIAKVTGKDPSVQRFSLKNKNIDILSCVEHGDLNLRVHSTVGLSEYVTNPKNKDVELLLVAHQRFEFSPSILATAALRVLLDGWQTTSGALFSNIFVTHGVPSEIKHGLIIPQYLWKESLKKLDLGDRLVEWKMIVPLTDTEAKFLLKNEPAELLAKFVDQGVNLFDLNRLPIIL